MNHSWQGYKMNDIQKVTFKNSKNLTLVGVLWKASSDAVIILAHGSGSNKRARGVFEPLAQALQKHGYNVLSFDFSGHGESDDAIVNMQGYIDDLRSAIAFAKKEGYARIALFGHSYGALAALKVYNSDIQAIVLLGALAGPVIWRWEDMLTPEQLQDVYQKGYMSEQVDDGLRAIIQHDKNTFKEIADIDQKQLLSAIECPVLFIHGDADTVEQDLLVMTQKALTLLPKGSQLVIIPGASHTFVDHVPQVIEQAVNWYGKHF